MPIRKAFRMKVHSGCEEEYRAPPSSCLGGTRGSAAVTRSAQLLDLPRCRDPGPLRVRRGRQPGVLDAIAQTETCRRWWRYMSELMPSVADHSPLSSPLLKVFHL